MIRRLAFLLVVCTAISASLWGQGLSYRCQENPLLSLREPVLQLGQAHSGHLLVGQANALHAFDGQRLKTLDLSELGDNSGPSCFFTENQDLTWIGFSNGQIARLNLLGQIEPWVIEEGWPQAKITAIQQDSLGQYWIATYGEGVYCYRNERLYQFGQDDGLESEDIYSLIVDYQGQIWAISDAGLSLLSWKQDQKNIRHFSTQDGLPDDILTAIAPSKAGCWVGGYEGGIVHLNYQNGQINIQPTPPNELGTVTSITQVDEHELWVGTAERGLHIFSIRDWQWLPQQRFQGSPTRIQQLFFDAEGLLWVAAKEERLCYVQPRLQHRENIAESPQALTVDQHGTIWLGTASGLFIMDKDGQRIRSASLTSELNIISLYIDQYEQIWLGTFGQGLYVYEPEAEKLFRLKQVPALENGNIFSISGNEQRIWLATLHGVFTSTAVPFEQLDSLQFIQPAASRALGTDFLYCSYLDDTGAIWFGTDGHGLSKIDEAGEVQSFRYTADSTPIRSVYAVTSDSKGRIWISADQQQVYRLDEEGFVRPDLNIRFQPQEVVNVANDKNGNILVAHEQGVAVYDTRSEQLIDYHHLASVASFEPILNATHRDLLSGNVWIAGQQQLLCYRALQNNYRQQPVTSLSAISIYLEPFDFHQKNELNAQENNLIFQFDGVWLTDPEEVRFRYQLLGFDQNWIYSRDQQAVYSNLPPGEYSFQVQSTQNYNFTADSPLISYDFRIQKPFYLQWWFILLGSILAVFLIQWRVKTRENRLKKEAQLLKEKVVSQYEMLKSQINPHFLFNSFNTLVSLIEEEPEGAVTYVEKLADFYRYILQYRAKDVVTLAEEMTIVQDYVFLLKRRYQENLQLDIQLDNQTGEVPPFAVQMLIENAVKHNIISAAAPLTIRIYTQERMLVVENALQKKLTKQPSTGFGLQNIKSRYALLSKQHIIIKNDEQNYRVALPLL